jgi:membrane fusion protein, multidrug efflux system
MMNPGRHRMKSPRYGSEPARGPVHSDESGVFSLHNGHQAPAYESRVDDPTVRGRHAARHNGHSGVITDGAANGAATYGVNGYSGTETMTSNGNGHEPAVAVKVEPAVAPLHGGTRIRYGAKEIGSGSGDLGRAALERLRRHLPRRARNISLPRLALVLVLVFALLLAAAGVAVKKELPRLEGPANVVVATAAPAVIDNQPGGVGTIAAAPQDIATVALDVQGISTPIEITAVDVIANQYVAAGAPLLQLNPLPLEQNLQQIKLTLEQAQATLASAKASAANPANGSDNAYLAVQVPTSEGQVALDQQLLQIAQGNSTSITAPIAGYISEVRVVSGQVVSYGTTMVQVVNPTQVVVDAGMQLSDLPTVSVGDSATITPSQLPGVHLQGTVVAISAEASGDGLEGTVVVAAPNIAVHPVPLGSQSIVNISAPLHAAVSVPTLAVLNVEIAPVVGVVQNDRIHFQPVQIGASDGNRTQILSGLRAGEVVAVTNMQELTNGDKVSASSGGS